MNIVKRFFNRGRAGIGIVFIILGILLIGAGILSIITKISAVGRKSFTTVTGIEAQIAGALYIFGGLVFIVLGILLPIIDRLGEELSDKPAEDKK